MSDSLDYSFAAPDEVPDAARMTAHSFPGALRSGEWWQEQLGAPAWGGGAGTLLLGRDGRRIVAGLQAHPLRQWIGGVEYPCTGIGSVSIAPTHRRRGLAADLMTAALRAGHERGDVVSGLYPFRTSFYQRLGYGIAGVVEQYQVAPGLLPDAPERAGIELLESEAERTEALALYHAWAGTQSGQLTRPPRLWTALATGTDRALFGWRGAGDALEGYALVEYRTAPERLLDVDEMIWTSTAARRGLYGWLASMGDQWPLLILRGLPSHRLSDWIAEPRLPQGSARPWRLWAPSATLQLGTMFRLLDVPAAFSGRRLAPDASLDVVFDVVDAQIPQNTGRWRIAADAGVTLIEQGATSHTTVRCDISTLSRLFISALPATAALEAGLLECDRPEMLPALDAAFALPEPWTFDRF